MLCQSKRACGRRQSNQKKRHCAIFEKLVIWIRDMVGPHPNRPAHPGVAKGDTTNQ